MHGRLESRGPAYCPTASSRSRASCRSTIRQPSSASSPQDTGHGSSPRSTADAAGLDRGLAAPIGFARVVRVIIGLVFLVGGLAGLSLSLVEGATGVPILAGVAGVSVGLAVLIVGAAISRRIIEGRIRQRGSDARATVVAVGNIGRTATGNLIVRLQLRVEPMDGTAAYEAELETFVPSLIVPRPGDQAAVRYLPDEPAKVALAESATFAPPPARGAGATVDELSRLASLHRSGAITDAEYESLKQRLISG